MSQPSLNLRGAVDLSGLGSQPEQPGTAAPTGGAVQDVTTATFNDLVQQSNEVPVVVDLRSPRSPASTELSTTLQTLAAEYGGRFLLARVDVDAHPQIAQAFQAQSAPTVCAVLKGQPLPLFQGPQPAEQIRAVLDEVLRVAAENGVTGTVDVGEQAPEDEETEEPAEPPLPPHLQAAYDAIEADDLDAAASAFEQALNENPGDNEAKAGLAQVELGRRLEGADLAAVLTAAANAGPADVDEHLAAADAEAASGQMDRAFERLIGVVRVTAGPDRETVRQRLLELFRIVPEDSPELIKARRDLAIALY